jgi:Holliday junction resolvasome RuvABC endonuclease subunit
LDVSSAAIGYAIIDSSIEKILEYGHIKPPKKDKMSIVERLDSVSKEVDKVCNKWIPDIVGIEEISKFMARRSSANTMITLGIFNRVCALQAYKSTNKVPIFLYPISIRTKIKKYMKLLDKIHKENMPEVLKSYFGDMAFKITMKKNKTTISPTTYDEADAVAVAFAIMIDIKAKKS